jgi:hypothetical protein
MSSEAAARLQKLQKRREMVHHLDKSPRAGKVPTTRLNGVLVLASDDLDSASGRIPKPCVVGSNPTGGADALGPLGNGPAVAHHRGSSVKSPGAGSRAMAGGCAGQDHCQEECLGRDPRLGILHPVAAPLSAALNALRMTGTTTCAHDLPLGDPMPLPTSPRVESIPRQEDLGLAPAVLWSGRPLGRSD